MSMKNVEKQEYIMIRPFLILSLVALGACETAEGFGRDLKKAGEAIEEEAAEG